MKKLITKIMMAAVLAVGVMGCEDKAPSAKSQQSQKAAEAANSINFAENAEIENIKRRLELTSNPGALGFILLMNESGQPIMYTTVKGKVTSGGKRLTEPDRANSWGAGTNNVVRQAPSDEGTYGSSDPYIYFWTSNGQYVQHNGKYLYSDKPLRINVQPLVINIEVQDK
ncbi:MAG: hypothetical protein ACXW1D_00115 [Halobacteriota archaeon]